MTDLRARVTEHADRIFARNPGLTEEKKREVIRELGARLKPQVEAEQLAAAGTVLPMPEPAGPAQVPGLAQTPVGQSMELEQATGDPSIWSRIGDRGVAVAEAMLPLQRGQEGLDKIRVGGAGGDPVMAAQGVGDLVQAARRAVAPTSAESLEAGGAALEAMPIAGLPFFVWSELANVGGEAAMGLTLEQKEKLLESAQAKREAAGGAIADALGKTRINPLGGALADQDPDQGLPVGEMMSRLIAAHGGDPQQIFGALAPYLPQTQALAGLTEEEMRAEGARGLALGAESSVGIGAGKAAATKILGKARGKVAKSVAREAEKVLGERLAQQADDPVLLTGKMAEAAQAKKAAKTHAQGVVERAEAQQARTAAVKDWIKKHPKEAEKRLGIRHREAPDEPLDKFATKADDVMERAERKTKAAKTPEERAALVRETEEQLEQLAEDFPRGKASEVQVSKRAAEIRKTLKSSDPELVDYGYKPAESDRVGHLASTAKKTEGGIDPDTVTRELAPELWHEVEKSKGGKVSKVWEMKPEARAFVSEGARGKGTTIDDIENALKRSGALDETESLHDVMSYAEKADAGAARVTLDDVAEKMAREQLDAESVPGALQAFEGERGVSSGGLDEMLDAVPHLKKRMERLRGGAGETGAKVLPLKKKPAPAPELEGWGPGKKAVGDETPFYAPEGAAGAAKPKGRGIKKPKPAKSTEGVDFMGGPNVQEPRPGGAVPVPTGKPKRDWLGRKKKIKTGLPKKGPLHMEHLVQHVQQLFGAPVRGMKQMLGADVGTKQALRGVRGLYKRNPRVIRSIQGDLKALTHEVAHHIEETHGLADFIKKHGDELGKLDYDANAARPLEGYAEYIRMWLTGHRDPRQVAPEFHKAFVQLLKDKPDLAERMSSLQKAMIRFTNQTAKETLRAHWASSWSDIPVGLRAKLAWMHTRRLFVDDWAIAEAIEKQMRGLKPGQDLEEFLLKNKIPLEDSPSTVYRAERMTSRPKAAFFVLEETTDYAGNRTGESLREALSPLTEAAAKIKGLGARGKRKEYLAEFVDYIVSKRSLELIDRGIEPGVSQRQAQEVVKQLQRAEFDLAFERIKGWNDRVWDYVVESGAISREAVTAIRAANNEYVPFARVIDDLAGALAGGKGTLVHKIEGSMRRIKHPLMGYISNAENMIRMADKTRVMKAFGDMADELPGAGIFIEKIPLPDELANMGGKGGFKQRFADQGIDLSDSASSEVTDLYRNMVLAHTGKENVITFFKDGQQVAYSVHPELYKALTGSDRPGFKGKIANTILWLASRPAVALRTGATGLNVAFSAVTNPTRDTITALLQAEHGARRELPFAIVRSFMPKDEFNRLYRASGGAMSTLIGGDQKFTKVVLDQALASGTSAKIWSKAKHPIEAAKELIGFTEKVPRMAAMAAGAKKGARIYGKGSASARLLGVRAASEITTDFKRMGTLGMYINQIFPFWNAGVQGGSRFLRFYKKHPVQATVGGLTLAALAVNQWWNDKDKLWYRMLRPWEIAGHLFWDPLGESGDGSEMPMRFALPQEWGALFGGLPTVLLDYAYRENPEKVRKYLEPILGKPEFTPKEITQKGAVPGVLGDRIEKLVETAFPMIPGVTAPVENMLPQAVRPIVEYKLNQSIFRGRPQVPHHMLKMEPRDQWSARTTKTARWIGDKLGGEKGLSPIKLEHLAMGYFGSLGPGALRLLDYVFFAGSQKKDDLISLMATDRSANLSYRIQEQQRKIEESGDRDHPSTWPVASRWFVRTLPPEEVQENLQWHLGKVTEEKKRQWELYGKSLAAGEEARAKRRLADINVLEIRESFLEDTLNISLEGEKKPEERSSRTKTGK